MIEPTEIDNSDFLRALLEGNRGECSRILHAHLHHQTTVHDLYEKVIRKIDEDIPNLPILVGGQAFRRGGQEVIARYPNVKYLPDLNSVDAYIKDFQLNG